jgi:hypothetical protein
MPTRTSTAWGDTASNTGASYGTINLASGIKITRIEVTYDWAIAGDDVTSSTVVANSNLLVGVQAIVTGNTPLTLPADLNNSSFLQVEHVVSSTANITVTPSTDQAWNLFLEGGHLVWAGQFPLFNATTVLFTTGQVLAGLFNIYNFGCMSIWTTDV